MRRIGGFRRKTRSKLRKNIRERGKISIRRFLQVFQVGEKVSLKAEPAYQKGMYFPRFHGLVGTVIGRQGKCYKVQIRDQRKMKELLVHPVHLQKTQNVSAGSN